MEEKQKSAEQQVTPQEKRSKAYENYLMLHDWAVLLAIVTIVFTFFLRIVGVVGSSMYPTLVNQDYLLLESNFLYREVKQGDIVVLNTPYFMDELKKGLIVKRVIAAGGQTVDIDFETGTVYVDGQALDEPYVNEPTWLYDPAVEYPLTVPENSYFVMGDNRNRSSDSRTAELGCVDKSCVLGKAIFILIPGRQTDMEGNVTGSRELSRFGVIR